MVPRNGPRSNPIKGPPNTPKDICPATPKVIVKGQMDRTACSAAKTDISPILVVVRYLVERFIAIL
jgi:hypothetical protein